MEEVNLVKSWELKLRKEIYGLKDFKEKIISDSSISEEIKHRFIDILRTVKMSMIQVIAKCAQLRTESLSNKAFKVRVEKLQFNYEEACKSLEQLLSLIDTKTPKKKICYKNDKNNDDMHDIISKELTDIRISIKNTEENVNNHKHQEYEKKIENLESENQKLRRNLNLVQDDCTETFEILLSLKKRVEKLEMLKNESRENSRSGIDLPKRRGLLKPSNHAEELLNLS